jgi:hypothetical protein
MCALLSSGLLGLNLNKHNAIIGVPLLGADGVDASHSAMA